MFRHFFHYKFLASVYYYFGKMLTTPFKIESMSNLYIYLHVAFTAFQIIKSLEVKTYDCIVKDTE